MRGTSSITGKALSGMDHLKQSITDILSTPVGSRVLLREYGSRLWELIDAPLNRKTTVQFIAATVEALLRWEPRIIPIRVTASASSSGRVSLALTCVIRESGQTATIDGIVITA